MRTIRPIASLCLLLLLVGCEKARVLPQSVELAKTLCEPHGGIKTLYVRDFEKHNNQIHVTCVNDVKIRRNVYKNKGAN